MFLPAGHYIVFDNHYINWPILRYRPIFSWRTQYGAGTYNIVRDNIVVGTIDTDYGSLCIIGTHLFNILADQCIIKPYIAYIIRHNNYQFIIDTPCPMFFDDNHDIHIGDLVFFTSDHATHTYLFWNQQSNTSAVVSRDLTNYMILATEYIAERRRLGDAG